MSNTNKNSSVISFLVDKDQTLMNGKPVYPTRLDVHLGDEEKVENLIKSLQIHNQKDVKNKYFSFRLLGSSEHKHLYAVSDSAK